MTKLRPEDELQFFAHLAERKGQPIDPDVLVKIKAEDPKSSEFDKEFFKNFPVNQTEDEIAKTREFEDFFKQNEEIAEAEKFVQTEKQAIAKRREVLLRVLSLLEWARKSEKIPESTTLISLFQWVSTEAVKFAEENKKTFSNQDINTLYLLKALVELRSEGVPDNTTLDGIIKTLDEKYESLKGIQ